MKRVIIIPDSFKGTLSSEEVIGIISHELSERFPNWQITAIPVADGGEGTVSSMVKALDGTCETVRVAGPLFRQMECIYGRKGKTAVIEVASCAGLPLVRGNEDPSVMTTYGVGQQVLKAIENGADHIIVGLGGSCSNDGGCGLAAALGVRFTDENGKEFIPVGRSLINIEHVDVSGVKIDLSRIKITAMCDIDNPLYGPEGAAYVYAPQKGADEKMVQELDEGLRHFHKVVLNDLGIDMNIPGAGAAGGIGGGLYGLLGAEMKMGIDVVLDAVGFDDLLENCDLVITGEGCFDRQSLYGKVIYGISTRCRKHKVDCVVIAGMMKEIEGSLEEIGIKAVYPTTTEKQPPDRQKAVVNLVNTVRSINFK